MNGHRFFRMTGLVAAVLGVSLALTAVLPANAVTTSESRTQLRVPAPGHSVSWTVTSPADTHDRHVVLSLLDAVGTAFEGPDGVRLTLRDPQGGVLFNGGTAGQLRAERFDLGELPAGRDLRIEASAELPTTAGNEYRLAEGTLSFRLDTEQTEQDGILAFTGLDVPGLLMIALGCIVVAVFFVLAGRRRNKEKGSGHSAAA